MASGNLESNIVAREYMVASGEQPSTSIGVWRVTIFTAESLDTVSILASLEAGHCYQIRFRGK